MHPGSEGWLAALDGELGARGVDPATRADVLVEVEGFLSDSRAEPAAHFGSPQSYASVVLQALGGDGARLAPAGQVVADVVGVTKRRGQMLVLDAIDLQVRRGEVVALVGANGAGKSTLLRILAGLEAATCGTSTVRGTVAYAPQGGGLDDHLRPVEHFELFGTAAGTPRAQARKDGLALARELGWPQAADAGIAGNLSGGTRRKLSVVCALLLRADLLLLDEPAEGLDASSRRDFWELLWRDGRDGPGIVVASHDPDVEGRAHTLVDLGPAR